MRVWVAILFFCLSNFSSALATAGCDNDQNKCPEGQCCSMYGYCGNTVEHCCDGCQFQCNTDICQSSGGGDDLSDLISEDLFEEIFPHMGNSTYCSGGSFYSYDALLNASKAFPDFATSGDSEARKRELAAFLAQTSYETAGSWDSFEPPDGVEAWGYCSIEDSVHDVYCTNSTDECPCITGKMYYGRGPMGITGNELYCQAGEHLGIDLLGDPDLVSMDPVLSFESAFWFWMTPHGSKPSCHEVIVGEWDPSETDKAGNRSPGFGLVTNIINGDIECGHGNDTNVERRISFYLRFCDMLEVDYGSDLDCYYQTPFEDDSSGTSMKKKNPIRMYTPV